MMLWILLAQVLQRFFAVSLKLHCRSSTQPLEWSSGDRWFSYLCRSGTRHSAPGLSRVLNEGHITIGKTCLLGGLWDDVEKVFEGWFEKKLLVHLGLVDQRSEQLCSWLPEVPHSNQTNIIFKSTSLAQRLQAGLYFYCWWATKSRRHTTIPL